MRADERRRGLPAALAIWEDMRAESVEADAMLYATRTSLARGREAVTEPVMFEMERTASYHGEVFATLAGIAARDGDVAGVEKVLRIGRGGLRRLSSTPPPPRRQARTRTPRMTPKFDSAPPDYRGIPRRTKIHRAAAADRPELAWSTVSARWISAWRSRFPSSTRSWWRAVARVCCSTFDAVDLMRAAVTNPTRRRRELLSSCAKHGDAELAWETYKRSRGLDSRPTRLR